MNLIDYLLAVLIIVASALCIALIYYIWKISKSVKAIQADINDLSERIQPLINSTTELSNNLNEITGSARGQIDMSKSVVTSIKDRVDTILNFEEKVRGSIEGPVTSLINEITAISNGITTFLNQIKNKRS
ncbi:MAG: hypothetical protein PVF17_09065 [Ignavibacteria bacterium]